MPVTLQKGINIGPIPRGLLSPEDGANGFPIGNAFTERLSQRPSLRGEEEKTKERTRPQKASK
jgi:hypothetical protein